MVDIAAVVNSEADPQYASPDHQTLMPICRFPLWPPRKQALHHLRRTGAKMKMSPNERQREEPLLVGQFEQAAVSAAEKAAHGKDSPSTPKPPEIDADSPGALINRELSWLSFARRVLALAGDPDLPLLERVKFAGITWACCMTNLR